MTFAQGDRPPRLALRNRETGRPCIRPSGPPELGPDLLPTPGQIIENIEEKNDP